MCSSRWIHTHILTYKLWRYYLSNWGRLSVCNWSRLEALDRPDGKHGQVLNTGASIWILNPRLHIVSGMGAMGIIAHVPRTGDGSTLSLFHEQVDNNYNIQGITTAGFEPGLTLSAE